MSLSGLIFLLAFGSGLLLAIVRHPLFGLYTYIAVFYLHPPSRWWGEFLPDLRWSLLAAAVTLASYLFRKGGKDERNAFSSKAGKILLTYVVLMWVQTAWALDTSVHLEGVVLFTKYLLLFYLIYHIANTPEKVTGLLMAHVIGSFYFGYLGFTIAAGGRLEGVGGPGVDDANTLAMHVGTAITVASLLLIGGNKMQRLLCFLALPFMLNVVILAGSRGAFLGLLMGGFALWYLKPKAYKRQFMIYASLGVVLFGILAHDLFWERIETITAPIESGTEVDSSTESRFVLFKAQWEMAKDHPFGAGFRGTTLLSRQYLDIKWLTTSSGSVEEFGARSSHNSFLTALVDQGFLGALLFLMLIAWMIKTLLKLKRLPHQEYVPLFGIHRAALGGALAVVFVSGVFTNYWKAEVQIWLIALLAAVESISTRYQVAQQDVKEPVKNSAKKLATDSA